MAYATQELVDSSFEYIIKTTITGTNGTATKIVDASELTGAATNPRLSIVACQWSVSSVTEIEFDATSNITALTLNGNGSFNVSGQTLPSIANNAGSGVTGDIFYENDSACVGFIILKCKKVSGFDNIS